MKQRGIKLVFAKLAVAVLVVGLVSSLQQVKVFALDSDFSDGITVDSVLDTADNNIGNGACNDGSGNCTLRAAIAEANANAGLDTIEFAIAGAGPHTITLGSSLPFVSGDTVIDGYTQLGSSVNTTIAPLPFDFSLAIVITGSGSLTISGDNSVISGLDMQVPLTITGDTVTVTGNDLQDGLVITSAANTTTVGGTSASDRNIIDGLEISGSNSTVLGNYIGVEADGVSSSSSDGILANDLNHIVGGSAAGSTNVISGTTSTYAIQIQGDGIDNGGLFTVQGNYIGTDYTGLAALPNNRGIGPAGEEVVIGGAAAGARNIISGNNAAGIFGNPEETITIENNYIGVGVDGVTPLGNGLTPGVDDVDIIDGIRFFQEEDVKTITDNIVSNNGGNGIHEAYNSTISGNEISNNTTSGIYISGYFNVIDFNIIEGNGTFGASVRNTSGVSKSFNDNIVENNDGGGLQLLAGADDIVLDDNSFSTNTGVGVTITGSGNSGLIFTSNTIDQNTEEGVWDSGDGGPVNFEDNSIDDNGSHGVLIDGVGDLTFQNANVITNNGGSGIYADNSPDLVIGGVGVSDGNTITGNDGNGVTLVNSTTNSPILGNEISDNSDLGIDLSNDGVTENDELDPDTGPNDLLNFPLRDLVTEVGADTEVEFVTDLPAGNYRIEFFSNPSGADPTGNGEGEVYLGATDIISAGTGEENFSYTLTGVTGVADLAMTATEDLGEGEYGATSEFGEEYIPPPPVSDLALTKTLDNPEDYEQDGVVNYTLTLTNDGPDPVILNQFDGSGNPFATSLFVDVLPPDHSISAGVGVPFFPSNTTDVTCLWYGPGSAASADPLFSNHEAYSIVVCAYSAIPEYSLNDGDSIVMTIPTVLSSDSSLNYMNFAFTSTFNDVDPEFPSLIPETCDEAYTAEESDAIDCLLQYPVNNFAFAGAPTDVELTKVLNNPEDVAEGETVSYTVTFTNNGPGDINLANYPLSSTTTLFNDLYPGADLTFVESATEDISCLDVGPGSSAFLGSAAEDHPDHQLLSCGYFGASQAIPSGGSFDIVLNFTVDSGTSSDFTNYVFHTATTADPDSQALLGAVFGASEDVMDSLTSNNFARASIVPIEDPTDGAEESAVSDGLSGTGRNIALIAIVAALLIAAGGTGYYLRRRMKTTR